ncbi:MAG TPA: hypothetical protein VFT22_36080, partial [Kofleriaceae bacterium]|nr:hypothetical protein [Kofleriaceae bacterium]
MRCTDQLVVSMLAIALVASPAIAQGPRRGAAAGAAPAKVAEEAGEPVTLAELLEAAVQRSPGLTIAKAEHDEGRDRSKAADAIDAWHLIARLSGQETTLDRALAGPAVALDTRSATAEVGVARSLSTGADITLTTSTGTIRNLYPSSVAGTQSQVPDVIVSGTTASARLEASQPLLRGAGEDVARADQRVARLEARALTAQGDDA